MLRRALAEALRRHPWCIAARRCASSGGGGARSSAAAVNSILLRSLKDHYLEVSKMNPPPKVNPPSPFTIVKGALDSSGPVLKRAYGNEEISLSVTRLVNIVGSAADDEDEGINQLFVHVEVTKPGQDNSLHFLCGLYPDALGIHSVSMRPRLETPEFSVDQTTYNGPVYEDLDERVRDSLHGYIDERGINESLFPFLQAWLYVKDHRNLMRWFKSVGTFMNAKQAVEGA